MPDPLAWLDDLAAERSRLGLWRELSPLGAACNKIVVLSVARLLGQAIKSIHEETSVSSLFV